MLIKRFIAKNRSSRLLLFSIFGSKRKLTSQFWESERADAFDRAKRLSDFIGMFLRLSFVLFCVIYLAKQSVISTNLFDKLALGTTAFCAGALYAVLFSQMAKIIWIEWAKDTAHWKYPIARAPIAALAIWLTILIGRGSIFIAESLANSSVLLR